MRFHPGSIPPRPRVERRLVAMAVPAMMMMMMTAMMMTVMMTAPVALGLEVEIGAPGDGDIVWGMIEVAGSAAGAVKVLVRVDSGPFQPATGTDTWTFQLDAAALAERDHRITARAEDGAGGVATDDVFVIANPESPPVPDCGVLVPGTPLPYTNPAAPAELEIDAGPIVYLEIIGHSENRGYDDELQALLDADPPGGRTYVVTNHWIGGHETWRWVTPGQQGYEVIEGIIQNIQGPTIALILTSNNVTHPAGAPNMGDPNYARFVDDCEALADHLDNGGAGVLMSYFSAHRMKPGNLMPCHHENVAIGDLLAAAGTAAKPYIKAGPEQHDLHWCCYPACYAADHAHTNDLGDALMAQAWFGFLVSELRFVTGTVSEVPAPAPPFRMGAPYPNPAGRPFRVPVELDRTTVVRLGLFDAGGRLVGRSAVERLGAGERVIELDDHDLDGRRLPSGRYWIRVLEPAGIGQSAKLLVLR